LRRKEKKPQQKLQQNPSHNTFDVKSNLKKLGTSIERNSYMGNGTTEGDYIFEQHKEGTISSYQEYEFKTKFELYSLKQEKEISNVLTSFKETVHGKINQDVKEAKKDIEEKINCFETKLGEKVDNKYFIGSISVLIIITTIIATLSYYPLIEDVKNLNEKNNQVKDSINKINSRIDKHILIETTKKR
jgi:hypothetical protein